MNIHKNEITTGLLVLATAAVLICTLAVLGAPGLIKPLNRYKVYYDNASGIRPGAPVLLAGREIFARQGLKLPGSELRASAVLALLRHCVGAAHDKDCTDCGHK